MTDKKGEDVAQIQDTVLQLSDGRKMAVWRSGPEKPAEPGRIAIVAQGFCRRMRHMAALSRYLVDNGFVVYRCDYVDHVGLSEGNVFDFKLGGSIYNSVARLHDYVLETTGVQDVVLIAASLAARAAFRLAAERTGIAGIIGIVGVVNTRYTLHRACGVDFGSREPEDWGEELSNFEGKKTLLRTFTREWRDGHWMEVAHTLQDLRKITCPVVNFCGTSDDWVDVEEVKQVFGQSESNCKVVQLPYVEHELKRNPVAAQTILREVTRCALQFAGAPENVNVIETSFLTLAEQIPYERRFEIQKEGQLWPTSTTD